MGPRLLKRNGEHKYEFTARLLDEEVPKYAILSHTWGADAEEVTHNDFLTPMGRDKAGYAKITFCGEQAYDDGLDHFWIDSCCINKNSEPETSEAINSMFRWYKNAAKCYVYLSDVSSEINDWQDAFRNSRWFTRGWTLQELLAPAEVEFFSIEGTLLGDRLSLKDLIGEVTGLPKSLLEGGSISDFSFAERKSWIAKRRTRLPEDRAYSLLGIFDIHMPVIYGEGEQHAFTRLQEKIEKRARTLQATQSRYETRRIDLPPLSPHFTGRLAELRQLEQYLLQSETKVQARAAIVGIGGSGKTALAASFAAAHEDRFSAIFFANAKDTVTLRKAFMRIARTLGLPEALQGGTADSGSINGGSAAVDAVLEWLVGHPSGNWLLIFDNANDLESIKLNDWLPRANKGHIIITSQDGKGAASYTSSPPVQLGRLQTDDAVGFFVKRSKMSTPDGDQMAACTRITAKLGCLALAIEHAAAYLHAAEIPLADFEALLERNILQGVSKPSVDSLHSDTVQVTVHMAWEDLKSRNQDSAWLLRFIANCDITTLDENYLLSDCSVKYLKDRSMPFMNDRQKYFDAKQVLLSLSMIQCIALGGSTAITMHPLVQIIVQHCWKEKKIGAEYKWLLRSAGLAHTLAKDQNRYGDVYFSHFRFIFLSASRLWEHEDRAESTINLWIVLAGATLAYRVHWQILGLMYELDALCQVTMEALRDDTDLCRIMKCCVVTTRLITIDFTNSTTTALEFLHSFLQTQMTTAAGTWIDSLLKGGSQTPFHAYTLVDVFCYTSNPEYMNMMLILTKHAAVLCSERHQLMATAFIRMSQLPLAETWQTRLQRVWGSQSLLEPFADLGDALDVPSRMTLSAIDRQKGDIGSTILLLEQAVNTDLPPEKQTIPSNAAMLDLMAIYMALGRKEDAAAVVARFEPCQTGDAEVAIARQSQDFYIWLRKAKTELLERHEQHTERLRILEETYRAAREAFGKVSLSSFHAALLLEKHYKDHCCASPAEREKYREDAEHGFIQLYGGAEPLRRAEGLNMGKILMEQGELEEALATFQIFSAEAERTLGVEDPVTKRARWWLNAAERDIRLEEQEHASGKVTLDRGSIVFRRTLNEVLDT